MKHIIPIMAALFVFALAVSAGGAAADITPVPGGFYISTDRVAYKYEPNGAIRISDFGVAPDGGQKHVVFTFISAGPFEPTGNPIERDRTVAVTGTKASIETHDTPHATLVYRANDTGAMMFSLDSRMGAIPRGGNVLIGDSDFTADLAVTNGRTISKSVDNLMVSLMPDDTLVFRVQGPSGSLSDLMITGKLDTELDVRTQGVTIYSDETVYRQGTAMTVDLISASRATFSFSGLQSDSVIVVDLSNDIYTQLRDHMTVNVGGSSLSRFSTVNEFLGNSQPGFALAEGSNYVEMLLRPGVVSGSIIVESIVPGFEPLLAVAGLSSAFVCIAAGAYLFRRKSK